MKQIRYFLTPLAWPKAEQTQHMFMFHPRKNPTGAFLGMLNGPEWGCRLSLKQRNMSTTNIQQNSTRSRRVRGSCICIYVFKFVLLFFGEPPTTHSPPHSIPGKNAEVMSDPSCQKDARNKV
jgi:hypothetical protein